MLPITWVTGAIAIIPMLAYEIMRCYLDDIDDDTLKTLVQSSYASFEHPKVTPVVALGDFFVLELFHGPTLAFKDVALQFLGNLFEHILETENGELNILGGDKWRTPAALLSLV